MPGLFNLSSGLEDKVTVAQPFLVAQASRSLYDIEAEKSWYFQGESLRYDTFKTHISPSGTSRKFV